MCNNQIYDINMTNDINTNTDYDDYGNYQSCFLCCLGTIVIIIITFVKK